MRRLTIIAMDLKATLPILQLLYISPVLKMVDREIKREYYIEIDVACRKLYELELDISASDNSLSRFTDKERIASKAYQRAFWFKFTPKKDLKAFTGRDFALKFMSDNGNTNALENWSHYPKKMQRQFQAKLEELTSTQDLWKKRINPICQVRCDKCKKHLETVTKCDACQYGQYCSEKCRSGHQISHKPVCHFLVNYLDWNNKWG
jgi:hypothetical protein